jgi:ubiquinone/menaquinone biosynthesis C-methylase UbiE
MASSMKEHPPMRHLLLALGILLGTAHQACAQEAFYSRCPSSSPDGIGKCYSGREIAQVMGHQAAEWLERPERDREEQPDILVRNLQLQPSWVVADIGAGSGYFTFRLARLLPQGKVLAVDVQPEMIAIIERRKRELGIGNVQTVLGRAATPGLAQASVDLVLLVDVYHEFSQPREMMVAISRALAPCGRVALVEYRAEDARVPIKPLHKMSAQQAIREMEAAGLRWLETREVLPWQHLMFFGKR